MKVIKYILSSAVALSSAMPAFSDQVILDDLIVQFSECVGNDCVNGENFGFDTLRLKENNLRIKFEDTSNSGSFPSNDWELTANDSSNGGANRFSITDVTGGRTPFTVEAGAHNHSLYVDDGGRIGLGTSSPVLNIHTVEGNTPALRLEQDGSSGFSPQTWDLAGNEANFFIRDASHSSSLPFRIKPGAGNDDAIVIAADGKIGMGTENPSERLEVKVAGPARLALVNTSIVEDATKKQKWILNSNGTFRITAGGSGVSEFLLDAAGNLVLAGSLTANGSTFPDYVFEEGYHLKTLAEIEQYIQENGHLPGVPSAEEVASRGGHNMTELQLTLLQKVEELTLYSIQQDKNDREQNRIIREQESRIRNLEEKVEMLLMLQK